jgi:hypothetical protein
MSRRATWLLGLAVVLAGLAAVSLAAPPSARAAVWRTCNGAPVIWRGGTNVHRNRCSIADSGPINSAYWNGLDAWNRLAGAVTSFFVNGSSDCSISHGDGENEVGLVDRTTIDGANGLTILQLGPCFVGSNSIDEADVMIANDLSFTAVWGNYLGTTGRGTFVHELGHFFGFNHEDAHTIMRTTPPHLVTGGVEPATSWPRDAIGVSSVYGFVSSRPNLIVSALGLSSGGNVQTLDPAITFGMCRGGNRTTRIYVGNSGNVASGTYTLRIRLSPLAPPAGYTSGATAVATFSHAIGAFGEGTFDLPFTIPTGLADGTYHVYVDMDPGNAVPEAVEGDNTTVSAMRLQVNC